MKKLYVQVSDGSFQAASNDQIIEAALSITDKALRRGGEVLSNSRLVIDFLMLRLGGLPHEVFAVIFLNSRHQVLGFEEMFRGTIDGASVHTREVVKAALAYNAGGVILSHNHPSGVAEPSEADEKITRRLKAALGLVEIRVLDHIIIGRESSTSFSERGLL